ncbi:unnamed protein product [Rhizophagus irregularis]|nr:unnamed protein product [Rhizophagus irregularis]CAB5197462.1 unnamed protein product [Rhizophagus irregularis]
MEVSVSSTLRLGSVLSALGLGYADLVLRLGLGYADMASGWYLAVDRRLRMNWYRPSDIIRGFRIGYMGSCGLDAGLKWLFGSLWTQNSDFSSDLDTGFPGILPSDKIHAIFRTGPFSETYNISNPNISNSNTPNSN